MWRCENSPCCAWWIDPLRIALLLPEGSPLAFNKPGDPPIAAGPSLINEMTNIVGQFHVDKLRLWSLDSAILLLLIKYVGMSHRKSLAIVPIKSFSCKRQLLLPGQFLLKQNQTLPSKI